MKKKLSRASTMDKVLQIVDDEIESTKKMISARIKRCFRDGNQSSADQTNMKLKFTNKISNTILTSEEIKCEGGGCLEVALVDGPSEKTVDVGAEASARVEIVLLKGEPDADDEEFDQNIVPEKRGKKPLLDGDVAIRLERGVGVVQNVKLRNHAIEIRPPVFKLGARVVDEFRVKEAKTESFTVKDYRTKYHMKHQNPSLSDEVSRLCNIAKNGEIYKRLHSNGINTVEEFLIQLLINHDKLKSIVGMVPMKWEATIENARKCLSETRMYCYINLEQKKCVVFNVLGQCIGLYDENHYSLMMNMLSEEHKADAEELLVSAYKNWGDVKWFDDRDSLQQHLITFLSTYSINPYRPGGGDEAAEMIGESSSRPSNASFHSLSSVMNSVIDNGGENIRSFDSDIEAWFPDYWQQEDGDEAAEMIRESSSRPSNASFHSLSSVMNSVIDNGGENFGLFDTVVEALVRDFDDYWQQKDAGCNEQNGDGEEGGVSVEVEVVQTSDSPRRWKNLFSKWFSFKKRGSTAADDAPHFKKQKIG